MRISKQVVRILIFVALSFLLPASLSGAEEQSRPTLDIPINTTDLLLRFALDIEQTDKDCSHLVHDLYQRSGLDYLYADSRRLYEGVEAFQRVSQPQPGDLIVWRGHVGIVVDPEEHTFVSALRSGVKISSYVSGYWKRKGVPRFYHYAGTNGSIESYSVD